MTEKGPRRQGFIRQFKNAGREHRIPVTLHNAFERAKIKIHIEGNERDIERLKNNRLGVLFLGDHGKALEPALLTAALGQLGRNDIHFLGLPVLPKLLKSYVGIDESELILPVLPGYLSKDKLSSTDETTSKPKRKKRHRHKLARLLFGRKLSEEKRKNNNNASLARASELLTQGDAVAIFPTGGGFDIHANWRDGAANILLGIPTARRKAIIIAPFNCADGFSPRQLIRRVARRSAGIGSIKPREFSIKFGEQTTAYDIIGNETNPTKITVKLKEHYMESLNPTPRRRKMQA